MGHGQGFGTLCGHSRQGVGVAQRDRGRPCEHVGKGDRQKRSCPTLELDGQLPQGPGSVRHTFPRVHDTRIVRVERRARQVVFPAQESLGRTFRP